MRALPIREARELANKLQSGRPIASLSHPDPCMPVSLAALGSSTARPTRTQSFSVVLLIELWERFGYYGMQAILLLFMVQQLGFRDREANLLWGAFAALTYAAPAVGGWIGDSVLGSRRTILLGPVSRDLGP